jgi:DNA-directed RNA polymerase subunit beta'
MVFSPHTDVMRGTAAPAVETSADALIGVPSETAGIDEEVINEDLGSLHDILSQVERREDEE